jgi:phosphohistidine phosphatase SixA
MHWMHRLALALGLLGAVAPAALAADAWDALREPRTVAIMRHALAPGTGDPADFELGDCSTQRNLNDAGRAQARAIGDVFRANGIAVDRVLTSQWCRCRDTAELLDLAPVEDFPPLNSFYADRSTAQRQTRKTRQFLADLPDDERVVLVTHQVNITALTDEFPSSGEVFVLRMTDAGEVTVKGSVLIRP